MERLKTAVSCMLLIGLAWSDRKGQERNRRKRANRKRCFEEVDDFEDDSRSPAMDWMETLLEGIFISAGVVMMGYVLWLVIELLLN
ncbi:hypothetical protein AALB39_18010 [Lachnospiraceae bacterium 54-53]